VKKLPILIWILALVTCLIVFGASTALAVDTSKDNCHTEVFRSCRITTLNTNQYTGNRPLIIFFPGSNECDNAQKTIGFIRKYELYDGIEADLIAVSIKTECGGNHHDWEGVSRDVLEFIKDKYYSLCDDEKFPIIVDAVSFGGYGGCYLTQLFMENGLFVDELNLADACGAYCIKASWVQELAEAGTKVNVFACTGSGKISQETRAIIAALDGSRNFYGATFYTSHGKVLQYAIYNDGLHSEYKDEL